MKIEAQKCPACNKLLDSIVCVSEETDESPSPGDYTFCSNCAELLIFDENIKHRPLTSKETEKMVAEFPNILQIQDDIRNSVLSRKLAEYMAKKNS